MNRQEVEVLGLGREDLLKLYRDMWYIRSFEDHLEYHFKRGEVPGFFHSGVGQEAVQVAVRHAITKRDYFFPDHRCHGIIALSSEEPERVMAEIFGKATGLGRGKGGSLHIAEFRVGNMGNNPIEGSTTVTVLGTAFASKYRGTDQVSVVFIGDGTMGRGEVHESLNLASTWKLPVIYACVNNLYAISTRVDRAHPTEHMWEMALGYKIPTQAVDGNDVLASLRLMREAVLHARSGAGPYYVEFKTYRWQGHFSGDPASYRPQEEVEYWKARDPIRRMGDWLLSEGLATQEELDAIKAKVDQEIEGLIKFAQESPLPNPEEAIEGVFVGRRVKSR